MLPKDDPAELLPYGSARTLPGQVEDSQSVAGEPFVHGALLYPTGLQNSSTVSCYIRFRAPIAFQTVSTCLFLPPKGQVKDGVKTHVDLLGQTVLSALQLFALKSAAS